MDIFEGSSSKDFILAHESLAPSCEFPKEPCREDSTEDNYLLPESNTVKITSLPAEILITTGSDPSALSQLKMPISRDSTSLPTAAAAAASLVSSNLTSALVIKSRKPRRKIEKPLIKTAASSESAADVKFEVPELILVSAKKQNALESLKQAQSLFKFIPRGVCHLPSGDFASSSLKICKAQKVTRLLSECLSNSSSSAENNSKLSTAVSMAAGHHCKDSDTAKPNNLSCGDNNSQCAFDDEMIIDNDFLGLHESCVPSSEEREKEQNLTIKSKLKVKNEKTKQDLITGVLPHITAVLHLQHVHTDRKLENCVQRFLNSDSSNEIDQCNETDSDNNVASLAGLKSSQSYSSSPNIAEKLKGKRKYTFHQPATRKRDAAAVIGDTGDGDICPYFDIAKEVECSSLENGSVRQRVSKDISTFVNPSFRPKGLDNKDETDESRFGSFSEDGEGFNLHMDQTVGIEEQDPSSRTSFPVDDSDINNNNNINFNININDITKSAKSEKKESIKRVPKESKECSMSDVPGRQLLGSKMLSFIRAFPEGDVVGNDDIETVSTQKIRMEGWLQIMKNQSNVVAKDSDDGNNRSGTKIGKEKDTMIETNTKTQSNNLIVVDDFTKIKHELLNAIEDKLTKATPSSGRGGYASSTALKPGIVQILSQYEVRY